MGRLKQLLLNSRLPKVSIIIVNYNGRRWLEMCLPLLFQTNYPNYEVILIDNASTDASIDYVRAKWNSRVKVVVSKENVGFAGGNNLGFKNSTGEIIALLNNDTQVDKDWLLEAVQVISQSEQIAAVQSKTMQLNDRKRIDCVGLSIDSFGLCRQIGHGEIDYGQYDDLGDIWAGNGAALVIKREVLERVGFFDSSFFLYYEDVDLSWRIRLAGYKISLCSSSVIYHAGSATTQNTNPSIVIFHSTKNHLISCLKNYASINLLTRFPVTLSLHLTLILFEIIRGKMGFSAARLKAIVWVLRNGRTILEKRRQVQFQIRNERIKDKDIFKLASQIRDIKGFVFQKYKR